MPNDEVYYFDEQTNSAPWEFIYMVISGNSVHPYYKYITDHLGTVMHLSEFHPALQLLVDLHGKAENGLLTNAFVTDYEVFHFLCLLCDQNNHTISSRLVESAKRYVRTNFQKSISLTSIADSLSISSNHLSREFVKHTGEQLIHYITKIRLQKAIDLLYSSDLTIQQISSCCGFTDSNYFSKVFKKYMKVSPKAFRNKIVSQGYKSRIKHDL